MTIPTPPRSAPLESAAAQPTQPGRRLILILAIVCGVLLLATGAFGAGALALSNAADAGPKPAASTASVPPTPDVDPSRQVRDCPVTVTSDIEFRQFFFSGPDAGGFSALFADIHNPDETRAATVFYDVSLYDEDDILISRWSANHYLLPAQNSIFVAPMKDSLSEVASITVEQTKFEYSTPIAAGTVTASEVRGGDENLVAGTFTSTLNAPSSAKIYFVAQSDDEIIAACWSYADIPVNDTFTSHCRLEPASRTESDFDGTLPENVKIATFFELDLPL